MNIESIKNNKETEDIYGVEKSVLREYKGKKCIYLPISSDLDFENNNPTLIMGEIEKKWIDKKFTGEFHVFSLEKEKEENNGEGGCLFFYK